MTSGEEKDEEKAAQSVEEKLEVKRKLKTRVRKMLQGEGKYVQSRTESSVEPDFRERIV